MGFCLMPLKTSISASIAVAKRMHYIAASEIEELFCDSDS